jgi:hypothetical protein
MIIDLQYVPEGPVKVSFMRSDRALGKMFHITQFQDSTRK